MRSHITLDISLAGLIVGLVGLPACSLGDEGRTDVAERARPADCEPPAPTSASASTVDGTRTGEPQVLRHDGQERAYLLALPDGDDGTTARPLVLNFHGWASSKEEYEELTRLAERGTARGYVVVTPDALGEPPEWNMFDQPGRADDYGFVEALVGELTDRLCLDPARIYASGLSAGSAFAGFLACREPYRFAAVAMVAAFIPPTCPPEHAPSVIAFQGTADPLVPYRGGQVSGGGIGIPAALDTFAAYAEQFGCGEPVVEEGPVATIERRRLPGCAGGRDVVLHTIVGGGHEWPGAEGTAVAAAGERFFATDTILDFFDEHARPGRRPAAGRQD